MLFFDSPSFLVANYYCGSMPHLNIDFEYATSWKKGLEMVIIIYPLMIVEWSRQEDAEVPATQVMVGVKLCH